MDKTLEELELLNYKIEQDADGQLWYRGWRLKIVICGEEVLGSHCLCRQPLYLAYPPYEATLDQLQAIWLQIPNGACDTRPQAPQYAGWLITRRVDGQEVFRSRTIQEAIDVFEEQLEVSRKNTWEEVNANQNS